MRFNHNPSLVASLLPLPPVKSRLPISRVGNVQSDDPHDPRLRRIGSRLFADLPLAVDLYCGLGGWAEGFLSEGYSVVGFDVERHDYGTGGYPGQLIIQDVRTLHGSQFKGAAVIVGSSPCQEFSYRAMPWKRAKALPPPYLGMELFQAQFRIQRE